MAACRSSITEQFCPVRISRKRTFGFLLLCPLALIGNAEAGGYEIIKGKNVEVCEEYQKNLNSFKPMVPMLCERGISPDLKQFSQPTWTKLDLQRNKRLLWNVYNTFGPVEGREASELSDEGIDRLISKWIGSDMSGRELHRTKVDIDNDGVVDDVLMYKNGICGVAQWAYATAIVVQEPNKPEINSAKTDLLLQNTWTNPKTGEVKRDVAYFLFNMYGVFEYKGKAYFDKTDARQPDENNLKVFIAESGRTTELCEFQFSH